MYRIGWQNIKALTFHLYQWFAKQKDNFHDVCLEVGRLHTKQEWSIWIKSPHQTADIPQICSIKGNFIMIVIMRIISYEKKKLKSIKKLRQKISV